MGSIEDNALILDKIMEMVNNSLNQDKAVAIVITTTLAFLMQIQLDEEVRHDVQPAPD